MSFVRAAPGGVLFRKMGEDPVPIISAHIWKKKRNALIGKKILNNGFPQFFEKLGPAVNTGVFGYVGS